MSKITDDNLRDLIAVTIDALRTKGHLPTGKWGFHVLPEFFDPRNPDKRADTVDAAIYLGRRAKGLIVSFAFAELRRNTNITAFWSLVAARLTAAFMETGWYPAWSKRRQVA